MIKSLKKHQFLFPFARISTRAEGDVYDAIPFRHSESVGDETAPALTAPASWSEESVALMAEGAACADIPADLRAVEENTVPSWLWKRESHGAQRVAEGDLRQIFDRAVGSAVAKGWGLGLFSSEKHARVFYDEARFALIQRQAAIAPNVLRHWGLSWAYNIHEEKAAAPAAAIKTTALSNTAIDALIGKGKNKSTLSWKKIFTTSVKDETSVVLSLSDIAADWHSTAASPACAVIDLMALRHNDGSLNIEALRQTARIVTVLFDLQECPNSTVGLANLAPLLLALGLAYDSEAGRAMAASIAALVTAECYAASAEMAALRGASMDFVAERETVMRILRNHSRAAHGDPNDYEKLSVLPAPLPLKNCPDLALAAEAQRRWGDVVDLARAYGLRATQVTDFTPSPVLAVLMQSATQGLEPLRTLTNLAPDEAGTYRTVLHPAVGEALTRLGYPLSASRLVAQHIVGAHSLRKAPAINAASLRARGITEAVFEKIEAYLPYAGTLRLAFTPYVLGVDFCRAQLKIPARLLESPRFDVLKHLGFSDADIDAAHTHCYGFGTVRNSKALHLRHRVIFACGNEVSADARIRMAAAIQSFVSGETGVVVTLPVTQSVERGAEITLAAWRRGLKALTISFDHTLVEKPVREARVTARRIKAAPQPTAQPIRAARQIAKGKKPATLHGLRKNAERRTRA